MTAEATIQQHINDNAIVLYMKGTPDFPQCGFSAQVVHILLDSNIEFETRDVLQDEELRQGIKEFSDWPTIPQLYVRGKFIGGCDIVIELYQSGELGSILKS